MSSLTDNAQIKGVLATNETVTIPKGKDWISFYNTGANDATLKSYDADDNLLMSWTLPAGTPFSLARTSRGWCRIDIVATTTTVEAIWEN